MNRWCRNRHSRSLKRRITQLTESALRYARELQQQNWRSFCDQLAGALTTKRAWHILLKLMGPSPSKTATNQDIALLIHNHRKHPAQLLSTLRQRLFPTPVTPPHHPDYQWVQNPDLDAPFTSTELLQALAKLARNTTQGHDQVTYKLLRNLDGEHLEALLKCYNDH
ncbi:hypothetical protein HPB48_002681 [Haemaphysalis longicornis]|uniref:Uncharacterized protein n=1 Tax=Haemaphysalis longicornis TaxID=44386 RepID=A0A9J6GRC2_HAELO|nr:hypothetical protein HPB48_002681 [Haemaphysalis longicornis]